MSQSLLSRLAAPAPEARGRRSRRASIASIAFLAVAVVVLAYLPYVFAPSTTSVIVTFFILLIMASMWNLLAGYAGLVSVGQQAYVGLGAYGVLQFSDWGVEPYLAVPIVAVGCAIVAIPTSLLVFRLRGDYFAVGTWVVAEVLHETVIRDNSLGGGSGAALTTLSGFDPTLRQAITYWVSLGCAVVAMLAIYLLLHSRLGLALTAIRDDETAARGAGVRVGVAKRIVYLVAAAGCGAAGGLLLISTLNVTPDSDFSVQWSAYMIFIAVIGGIGTMEGPLLGAIVFVVLQQTMSNYGAWYLVLLGSVAVVIAVWTRRGLWPLLTDRLNLTLFPTAHTVDDED